MLDGTRAAPAEAGRPADGRPPRSPGRPPTAAANCSVAAAGAELILFTPLFHQAEHAEVLAAEIIPQLG
jgi:hypothetical protein